jgi:hypothetical protein
VAVVVRGGGLKPMLGDGLFLTCYDSPGSITFAAKVPAGTRTWCEMTRQSTW